VLPLRLEPVASLGQEDKGWAELFAQEIDDMNADRETGPKQLLHLVFGGELTDLERIEFTDLAGLDIVGIFPNYAEAYAAWKSAAQRTVDNASMRYFIVHMHHLLEPEGLGGRFGSKVGA
jgi:hypothetical protein